ncbi:SH3 domain-containing protein [Wenxinia marina]|uniref:Bacterial SH3 domain protein n=1 Tax=Wenxinia marina DSM 24838 TaxID=1123501 RepID=A0A0D0NPI2_9RHOB|nr:SH3 domain-containing protein [Wenxinia marina]KIQ70170.1 Bacterial SH3 domain protein [Wenxinia marina DSM 24838]GGL50866.1 peptide-binding protein [Wenxinia marina]
MPLRPAALCLALTVLAACGAPGGSRVTVGDTGDVEFLNLRTGPGLGYVVVLGLPEGTALTRQDCVTELGQLWCRVALAAAPAISGYVAADFLRE